MDNKLLPWRVKGSRHIHRDRWISVRADDCVTANGIDVSPFYVLEYPDVVLVLAITTGNQVVLVRQYRHGLGAVTTELPGGIIDASDPDPIAAAARELVEETGYVSDDLRVVGRLSAGAASRTNLFHVVLALNVKPEAAPKPDPTEAIDVELVDCAKAVRMGQAGELIQAHDVAALLLGLSAAGKLNLAMI
ncbi:NUDIX hydrolase [Microvirga aerilata]|uniref:NUDIX hydrolase n=1 Tax=Microvirga aerilata TaxID=670292 RepID=A0A936ZDE0_9HYPH|nr:NUDIX hydrolase [Microvirga aerilata]MBL0405072.1 NUDIX hydrolase [Microvirga aerilata]